MVEHLIVNAPVVRVRESNSTVHVSPAAKDGTDFVLE
jgi:hypothetical protein